MLVLVAALLAALVLACAPRHAHAATYADVPDDAWYASWVEQASEAGLMTGYTDAAGTSTGLFGPGDSLTRAQVATVLWRTADMPDAEDAPCLSDVPAGKYYTRAVNWCVSQGIVTGYTSGADEGAFRPDRFVSRQELATMAYRYAAWAGVDVSDPDPAAFTSTTDWQTACSWATAALTWTAAAGVLEGVENPDGSRSILPFDAVTRAQAAKVFVVLSQGGKPCKAPYAVLYEDGLLCLQRGSDTDSAHGAVVGSWAWDGASRPWYGSRSKVKSVVVRDSIPFTGEGGLFKGLSGCTSMDVAKLDVSGAASLASMFRGCLKLPSLDLSTWDVSGVSDLSYLLCDCWFLTDLNLSGWDVSSATTLEYMFGGCRSLKGLNLTGWDVSHVTSLANMFDDCWSLKGLKLAGWDVRNVTSTSFMFAGCTSLASLDLTGWSPAALLDCSYMFNSCGSLASLDLFAWDVKAAQNLTSMFNGCTSLSRVTLGMGCAALVGLLPEGPWYDATGAEYDTIPAGVPGTYARTQAQALALAGDATFEDVPEQAQEAVTFDEVADEVASESSGESADEVAADSVGENVGEATGELASETAGETAVEVADGVPGDLADGASAEVTGGIADELTNGAAEEAAVATYDAVDESLLDFAA